MTRRTLNALIVTIALVPTVASAGDALDRALASIPADAMGFVCVPSLKDLDARYQKAVNDLQLQMFVPPPMSSILGLIRTSLPMMAGIDEEGPLTVVLMPVMVLPEINQKLAFLVPAKDPKAMIEAMNGQSTEDGLWSVTIMGQPHYAAIAEKMLVLGHTSEVVQNIKKSENGIGTKLAKPEKQLLSEVSVGLWLDGERLIGKLLKPMADGMLVPMMMMNAGPPGSFGAKSAEMNKKQIEMLMTGIKSLGFGLSLDDGGLGLRGFATTIPGSDLSKQWKMKPTAGSLLKGLPAREFIMAFGQTADPEQAKAAIGNFDPLFAAAGGVEGMDQEKMNKLKQTFERWALAMTGLRGTLELLGPGPGGLFGMSILVDTADSAEWLDHLAEGIELAKQLALGVMGAKEVDEEVKAVVNAIALAVDAEEIEGTKVRHLKFDLSKIQEIDEDDLEDVMAIIGKDGALLRIAPVGQKQVAISFGGGAQHMARLIQGAQSGAAPLDEHKGIKKVSAHLPKERASVFYVAAEQVVETVKACAKAVGEDEPPVQIEVVNAPLAAAGTGADGWARVDLFLPTELLVAGKNTVMALTAAHTDAAGGQQPIEAEEGDAEGKSEPPPEPE